MNGYADDIDVLLDSIELEDLEERTRRRPPVRTPPRRSSFTPRPTATPASQTQVQSTARNLDSKIETLGAAVKALEVRTNGLAADQTKLAATVRKEGEERRKSSDGIRADLQQTKLLSFLLPLLTQESVEIDIDGRQTKVLTQSQSQLASLLPIFFIMPGMSGGGEAGKGGGFGGDMVTSLVLLSVLTKK